MASDVSPSSSEPQAGSQKFTKAQAYQIDEMRFWADAVDQRGLALANVPSEIRLVVEQEVARRIRTKIAEIPESPGENPRKLPFARGSQTP